MPVTSPYWLLKTVVKKKAKIPRKIAAAGSQRRQFQARPTAAATIRNGSRAGRVASSVARPSMEFGL